MWVVSPAEARNVPVPSDLGVKALEAALSRQGDRYVWGGQRPGAFDCSGLIIWAYERATPGFRLPDGRGGYVADATMDHMWRYAVERVPVSRVRPGDVVFITHDDSRITHGGLVISVSETEVKFVSASSHHVQVAVDTWPLEGEKRGQWVVGFGRLMVIPGRRPPVPPVGDRTSRAALSMAGERGHLLAEVSEDGLQAEVRMTAHLGALSIGVGQRSWVDGWRGEQFIAGGWEPFAVVAAEVPVGALRLGGEATYAKSGLAYLGQVSALLPAWRGEVTLTAAYRHWPMDGWYSGPVVSIGVTF